VCRRLANDGYGIKGLGSDSHNEFHDLMMNTIRCIITIHKYTIVSYVSYSISL